MTPPQERRRTAVSADLRHRPQGPEHRTTQRNPAHRRAPGASRASERPARWDREERVTVPAEPIEPTAPVLRVAVTAPYPALRAGLRSLLLDVPGVEIVREANDPGALADGPPIDLLVADLGDEPDVALEALEAALPAQPAVLLADWTGELDGVQLQSAPRALLRRTASEQELRAAIGAVAAGLSVFAPELAPALHWHSPQQAVEPGDAPLTDREQEVLELLALGLPNKQIARRLGISEHTAKFHVGAILAKLGAASRTEAVTIAARRGLLAL